MGGAARSSDTGDGKHTKNADARSRTTSARLRVETSSASSQAKSTSLSSQTKTTTTTTITTVPATATSAAPSSSNSKSHTGLVVGLSVGILLLIVAVSTAAFFIWRRHRRRRLVAAKQYPMSRTGSPEIFWADKRRADAEAVDALRDMLGNQKQGPAELSPTAHGTLPGEAPGQHQTQPVELHGVDAPPPVPPKVPFDDPRPLERQSEPGSGPSSLSSTQSLLRGSCIINKIEPTIAHGGADHDNPIRPLHVQRPPKMHITPASPSTGAEPGTLELDGHSSWARK